MVITPAGTGKIEEVFCGFDILFFKELVYG
jgi:hypothetical protein